MLMMIGGLNFVVVCPCSFVCIGYRKMDICKQKTKWILDLNHKRTNLFEPKRWKFECCGLILQMHKCLSVDCSVVYNYSGMVFDLAILTHSWYRCSCHICVDKATSILLIVFVHVDLRAMFVLPTYVHFILADRDCSHLPSTFRISPVFYIESTSYLVVAKQIRQHRVLGVIA